MACNILGENMTNLEQSRNWKVQILDADNNVRMHAELFGTESKAKKLCQKFEKRRKKEAAKEQTLRSERDRDKQKKYWF